MRAIYISIVIHCLCVWTCRAQERAMLTITDSGHTVISRYIYSQFAEHLGCSIYDGFYRDGE